MLRMAFPTRNPDQQPASTLKDVKGAIACGALEQTNTRVVSLKEETKDPDQGGGSTGPRDPTTKQAREKTLDIITGH
eukprot:jgi/Psemu1/28465/gm1.28465_g